MLDDALVLVEVMAHGKVDRAYDADVGNWIEVDGWLEFSLDLFVNLADI